MPATPTPQARTERLLNLVICLLYTRRPLTKEQIRRAVAAYADAESDEAFDRMFERDKQALTELGIPLRAEQVDVLFEDEIGYRVDQREYALPEIRLEADEVAVLGLAARTWQQASLGEAAATALRKLRAEQVEREGQDVVDVEPRVITREKAFEPVKEAVLTVREITFTYRRPGGEEQPRRLQPWSLATWHGRWYVTGHDVDRDAPRVFRLDRMVGDVRLKGRRGAFTVPDDHDPRPMIERTQGLPERAARLRLRPGVGNALRREGEVVGEAEGWDVLELRMRDAETLADEITGLGPAAVVEAPDDLREAVVARWRRLLATTEGSPA